MKIIIISKETKRGQMYRAYRAGLLSRLNIFCFLNTIPKTESRTYLKCLERAEVEIELDNITIL